MTIVKLLFDINKIDTDWKNSFNSQTPLSWAAENGYEIVVKLLLESDKIDKEWFCDFDSRTPLSWAGERTRDSRKAAARERQDRYELRE